MQRVDCTPQAYRAEVMPTRLGALYAEREKARDTIETLRDGTRFAKDDASFRIKFRRQRAAEANLERIEADITRLEGIS